MTALITDYSNRDKGVKAGTRRRNDWPQWRGAREVIDSPGIDA
jgi:hypothetical protein